MIRAAIASVAFLSLTLVLILLQPSSDRTATVAQTPDDSAVTRAGTGYESYSPPVTDKTSAMLATPVAPIAPVEPAQITAAEPAVVVPAPVILPTPSPTLAPAISAPAGDLETLIVSALTEGQSDAYIDALVNDAAQKGKVAVPDTLITADGRVDTPSLLRVLQSSGLAAGLDETYVVQPGDSLAAISYRFYGNTHRAADIFNANRDNLRSPNALTLGQELVIPAL